MFYLQLGVDSLEYASEILQRVVTQVDFLVSEDQPIDGAIVNLTIEGAANLLKASTDLENSLNPHIAKMVVYNATTSLHKMLQVLEVDWFISKKMVELKKQCL